MGVRKFIITYSKTCYWHGYFGTFKKLIMLKSYTEANYAKIITWLKMLATVALTRVFALGFRAELIAEVRTRLGVRLGTTIKHWERTTTKALFKSAVPMTPSIPKVSQQNAEFYFKLQKKEYVKNALNILKV